MTESSPAPFHVGITPERVVDAAVDLTRESHLLGWSIRDLSRRLSVTPSVVYHHVGGKDLLSRRVVERVLGSLRAPSEDVDWEPWFRQLLHSAYPAIVPYPGVATWLLMHGPTFPSVLPIVETGIAHLVRGGFGDRAGLAYAALLNNAMLTVSVGDDRLIHEEDGPRDHSAMMTEFRAAAAGSPGLARLAHDFLTPFADGGERAQAKRREYYDFIVETTIAGLRAQRPDGSAGSVSRSPR